jgi:hypothetical protein
VRRDRLPDDPAVLRRHLGCGVVSFRVHEAGPVDDVCRKEGADLPVRVTGGVERLRRIELALEA